MYILSFKFLNCPLGVWIAFIALFLIFLAWIMQGYSVLNWEGAIKHGIQSESFTPSNKS